MCVSQILPSDLLPCASQCLDSMVIIGVYEGHALRVCRGGECGRKPIRPIGIF